MSYSALFRNRNFVFLWISQFLFQIAYNLLSFALIVFVFELTQSNFSVGVLMFSFLLPSFLFSLPAGVCTDLFSRRRILILTKVLWGLLVFLFLYLGSNFFLILILSIVVQAIDEFSIPAERGLLPQLVQKQELLFANSLFSLSLNAAILLGFGLAGPLMRFVGERSPFIIAPSLALLAAFFVSLVLISEKVRPVELRDLAVTMKEGFLQGAAEILARTGVLRVILMIAAYRGVVNILAALAPGYMEQGLGIYSGDASFVLALPLGAGLVMGTVLAGFLGKRKKKSYLVTLGIFLVGASLFLMAGGPLVRHSFYNNHFFDPRHIKYFEYMPALASVVIFLAIICGLGGALVYVSLQTFFQEITPNRLLGRGQAFLNMAAYALNIIPTLFSGAMADSFGVATVFLTVSLIILAVGFHLVRSNLLSELGD